MAQKDPRTGSPFTNTATNPGTGIAATGSVSVSVGDLVFVNYAIRGAVTVTVTDNLGNTYYALAAPGSGTGRAYGFYSIVTSAGTLTTVTGAHTSSSLDAAIIVAVFEGPFYGYPTGLDKNPSAVADSTSPFTGAQTGTLSYSDELVIGWMAQGNGAAGGSYGANNSFTVHGDATTGTGTNTCSGAICYLKVSATTTRTPEFTNATSTSGSIGTASFVAAAAELRVPKLNSYGILEVTDQRVAKLNSYVILDDPKLQVTKLNAYAVLTEVEASDRRRPVYTPTH